MKPTRPPLDAEGPTAAVGETLRSVAVVLIAATLLLPASLALAAAGAGTATSGLFCVAAPSSQTVALTVAPVPFAACPPVGLAVAGGARTSATRRAPASCDAGLAAADQNLRL